jgi:dTDP-glucose pyrophosphorylase
LNLVQVDSWRKTILPIDSTIQQAVRSLDESSMQIVLVTTVDGMLVGTVTDGDIRRGLLRGQALSSPIDTIVHRDAFVVPPDMPREMVRHLMQANRILQLPVVDAQHHVVGLHLWDGLSLPTRRQNLVVIMAGGLGTRLMPLTENCPKPMLSVAGKPMLEHCIERASAEGFGRFVLAIRHLGHMIEDYFGNGERWQVSIDYLREQTPLGTAGALSLFGARPDMPFIVSNGDVLTDIRFGELLDFHRHHGATATMAVRLYEWQHPYGVVQTKGVDITGFEEKPVSRSRVNAGIYVLEPKALDALVGNEPCDMPVLFERLLTRGERVIVYPMHEPWLDVGRPTDLEDARASRGGSAKS